MNLDNPQGINRMTGNAVSNGSEESGYIRFTHPKEIPQLSRILAQVTGDYNLYLPIMVNGDKPTTPPIGKRCDFHYSSVTGIVVRSCIRQWVGDAIASSLHST